MPTSAALRVREQPTESASAITEIVGPQSLAVIAVHMRWLNVGFGWIRREDVVELADATRYFSSEIERAHSAFAYCARGLAALRDGNIEGASNDIEMALRVDNSNPPAHCSQGDVLMARGMYADAVAEFTMALELTPQFLQARRGRAKAYMKLEQYALAVADLNASKVNFQREPEVAAILGMSQYLAGHDDGAINTLTEALRCGASNKIKSTCAQALLRRGLASGIK